jgi:transcriptional regulator with XRE-family HTH domain
MDWKEVISTLQAAGYTQKQIADLCGCSQPSINELATGKTKDPRDSLGQALRALSSKTKRKLARTEKAGH